MMALILPGKALAQDVAIGGEAAQGMHSSNKVEISTSVAKSAVEPGETVEAAVVLDIKDGWHLNANEPLQDYLIGTELNLDRHSGIVIAETQYPEPKLDNFGFSPEDLAVYGGEAPIFLSLRVDEDVEPGSYTLTGSLRIQSCSDEVCLAPTDEDVSLAIEVGEGGSSQNEALFANYEPFASTGTASIAANNEIAALFNESGFWLAFIGIFLIGLALNLTPCVYPMMSVTVALFGNQQTTKMSKSFGRASLYVGGIVVMYSVLGVAAAYTGALFGAWLQSPWVLAGIGFLLLLLALSMFGLYELQLPASLQNKLGGAQQATGPTGLFASGLLVGVFAAPCIGPPVIALLAFVGAQGDPLFGLATFAVLALGLGLPYLFLGTFSGVMNRMPKSGVWMVWVKKLFGVVLVGAALFYIGLAFFPADAAFVLPLTLVGGGIYLGLEHTARQQPVFKYFAWSVAAVSIIAGIFVYQYLQRPGVEWTMYEPDVVETAQAEAKPVLLDFYADWCIPCIELDRVTFTDEGVRAALADYKTVKVDLTSMSSEDAETVREKYDVAGVPTLVFLDEEGREVEAARIVGFIGPERMVERIGEVDDHRSGLAQN